MKLLLSTFCAVLLLSFSIAFAATLVAEPPLPVDIEVAWEKQGQIICTKYSGKIVVGVKYRQKTKDSLRTIIVFTLNGQKIDQREFTRVGESPAIQIRYVRNSPQNSWHRYEEFENHEAATLMLLDLGLTKVELDSCNE